MKKIVGSVVTYKNDRETLAGSIRSFLNSAADAELHVIDNSPTDDLKDVVVDPRVIYRHVGRNVGFGTGHNLVLAASIDYATYHVVLGPDVYFDPGVIPDLEKYMDQHSETGLVMPKILYPDGALQRLCKLLPSPTTLITRRFLRFLPALLSRTNYKYELQFADYDAIMEVPFLSGCFMFLRTAALRRVGIFDERFFLYSEDIDISRRIHRHFKTVYYPHVAIHHFFGKAPYKSFRALLAHTRSAILYFNKWGWWSDPERNRMNHETLARLNQH